MACVWAFLSFFVMLNSTRRLVSSLKVQRQRFTMMSSSAGASGVGTDGLLAVHVVGTLTAGSSEAFTKHSLLNAKNSILEGGISRFDVLKRLETDDDEFLLIEVYNTAEGPAEHKETAHYNAWRESVADMMAVPRSATKYTTLFPEDAHWATKPAAGDIDVESFSSQESGGSWAATLEESYAASTGMLAVVVDVAVVPGMEDAFIAASLDNCRNSIQEPGVHRFDLIRNKDDPTNFALVEVYNSGDAPAAHKATAHYAAWRDIVGSMMARPRVARKYRSMFPAPLHWHNSALDTHFGDLAKNTWSSPDISGPGLSGVGAGAAVGFSFLSPKVTMGRGIAGPAIATAVKELLMTKPFLVTGKSGLSRYTDQLGDSFAMLSEATSFSIAGEPTVEDALQAVKAARMAGCDGVVAIGGGSALDLGKAVAALYSNIGTEVDGQVSTVYTFLEGVGEGKSIRVNPIPFIAVPTTSGTGSEATKNAVLKCTKMARKASMRADSMLPDVAILDPCLTLSCPADVTAHVGLDTLCQVIEPFTSCNTNPVVDALAREGILRASRSLRRVVVDGADIEAREDLAVASLLSGQSLANAKLGAVHGFAGVLGGMYEQSPHGAICAALLPHVFRANAEKLSMQAAAGDVVAMRRLARFDEVARIVTGNADATAAQGALWLEALVVDLRVPGLVKLCEMSSVDDAILKEICKATADASSTKGNPVVLSSDELEVILRKAL